MLTANPSIIDVAIAAAGIAIGSIIIGGERP